ncbi:MAG: precorrin-2 C(20)-methyltransferase, partial [Desulfovibrionaceae bacterium]|nr:precorrin-2 C(20)-methyltransferase [Desulfovibrionaceae bacterium]
ETLRIVPGINGREHMAREMADADTAVILKAYRNFPAICEALRQSGRQAEACLASHVEQAEERLLELGRVEGTPPYMSLIISRKPGGNAE